METIEPEEEIEAIDEEIEELEQVIEHSEDRLYYLKRRRAALIRQCPPAMRPDLTRQAVRNWWAS